MKTSTTARGYGFRHQQARKEWGRVVESGNAYCTRCRRPIVPGSRWHLDHSPDRRYYLGAAHAYCNLRAGGKLGAAVKNARRRVKMGVSRQW